jgi:hypothetical protein
LTLGGRYGVYVLVINRGMKMRYGGGVWTTWGEVDLIVEMVGGGEPEIGRGKGFDPQIRI